MICWNERDQVHDKNEFDNKILNSSSELLLNDFTILALLGSGSYGEVLLIRRKATDKQYGLKVIDKAFLKREKKEYQIDAERYALSKLNHHGVVKLHAAFEDKQKIYLLMDFLPGGTLADYLKKQGPLGDEAARFLAAEMVLILEYLHTNGIAHRDFKPENLMLTEEGHLKAIDFGTAKPLKDEIRNNDSEKLTLKRRIEQRSTFVGTAYYVSPELLEENQCSAPADLWALGCSIFLMVTGKMPFNAQNEYLLFQKIRQANINWPSQIDLIAKDLIQKLLCRNPYDRLGADGPGSKNDYNALKSHPFFKGIAFNSIFNQKSPLSQSVTLGKRMSAIDSLPRELCFSQPRQSSSLILDEEVKLSLQDFLSTPLTSSTTNNKAYKILLTGRVDKKSSYLFYQPRQLVLTNEPKLKYIDPNTNQLKNEIPLTSNTSIQLESKTKFHVLIPTRKYTFKSLDHPAQKWVDAINELCKMTI